MYAMITKIDLDILILILLSQRSYCIVLYCIVLYCIVLYCIVLYRIMRPYTEGRLDAIE